MKTARKTKYTFAEMPREYEALCRLYLPRPIHDKSEYNATAGMAEVFAGFEEVMSPGQNDYFEMLCSVMEDWEEEDVEWRDVSPLEVLKHLLEEHDLSGADLSRILGATSRHLGPMILRGEREITAAHARALGARFGLPAGAFIE